MKERNGIKPKGKHPWKLTVQVLDIPAVRKEQKRDKRRRVRREGKKHE
jgi:hypothetical protein